VCCGFVVQQIAQEIKQMEFVLKVLLIP